MKKLFLSITYCLFQLISYSQNDTINPFYIGIQEKHLFCDYGIYAEKRLSQQAFQMQIGYSIGDLQWTSKKGNNGSYSAGIEYQYNFKPNLTTNYVLIGYTYRYIDFYGMTESDQRTTFVHDYFSQQHHMSLGYGKTWIYNHIQVKLQGVFYLQYAFTKLENYVDVNSSNIIKENTIYNGFAYIPSIEICIGYEL